MDEQQDNIDIALANIPEEVQDFMWSDAFTLLIDALQKTTGVTDIQKDIIRIEICELLLGIKGIPEVAKELSKDMTTETVAQVLYIIDSEFITRAENLTEFYTKDPEEDPFSDIENKNTLLNHLSQSFTTPTTLPPVKRVYADIPGTQTGSSAPKPLSETLPVSKPSIDPYRELPDVK